MSPDDQTSPVAAGRESSPWDAWAQDYDDLDFPEDAAETVAAVAVLTGLAAGGPVLEHAAGTGRIAVPLAQAGLDVTAADVSAAMLERLRGKTGGDLVRTRVERMPTVLADRPYALAVVVLNSIWAVADLAEQPRAVAALARALRPGGRLVLEVDRPQRQHPIALSLQEVPSGVELWQSSEVQPDGSVVLCYHRPDGAVRDRFVRLRQTGPDVLRQYAERAGLVEEFLWQGWNRVPHTPDAASFVGVWRKP